MNKSLYFQMILKYQCLYQLSNILIMGRNYFVLGTVLQCRGLISLSY